MIIVAMYTNYCLIVITARQAPRSRYTNCKSSSGEAVSNSESITQRP